MPTYKEQQILDKVCKVMRQKQIKYYDFIPFFDFQYEKIIFNWQPSHFSPCSAVPVLPCLEIYNYFSVYKLITEPLYLLLEDQRSEISCKRNIKATRPSMER